MNPDRLQILLSFLEEDPEDAFTRFALATEYLKQNDEAAALSQFERLLAEQPDYVGTYYHLGKLYEKLGRTDDGIETYRSGIVIAQKQNDFHARAELQDALMKAQGIGFDDD